MNAWAEMGTVGGARGRASVRDDRWNYCTAVGYEDEDGDELFDLAVDPEERRNVVGDHPQVVAECRAEVEALIGQPLPGMMVEVSDPATGPMIEWLNRRLPEL